MSELCPNVVAMIRYRATAVETLADALGRELRSAPADPFAEDLVLTRPGGIQRWLAQRLSSHLGSSGHGDGICARTSFLTFGQFAAVLRPGPGPWSPDSLLPEVMAAADDMESTQAFAQVRAHLGDPAARPRRRSAFAEMTATRFSAYARWKIPMLQSWSREEWVGPDGSPLDSLNLWQAYLWNHVCERVGSTPWEDADLICEQAASSVSRFARIAVFCPDLIRPLDEKLLEALDSTGTVLAFCQTRASTTEHEPGRKGAADMRTQAEFDRLSTRLGKQLAFTWSALDRLAPDDQALEEDPAPQTLLGAIQRRLATGESTPAELDDSIQIHAGHGDQQAEILADVLVRLLAEDPDLEPRDILVLVHRMKDQQPLLEAFFRPDDSGDPRHRIRASVSVAEPDAATAADLLIFLMGLVQGRATCEDLLRLASFPAVMNKFGFSSADLDRISTLVSSSGIRWGLNAAQRASQGMESFPQNTWMAGLGRMVLGVALSEEDLVYKGTVLPLDAVESDTVRLVEALGQIIAHVRTCCETWTDSCSPQEWASRFRETLDHLTGASWETTTVGKAVADFGSNVAPSLSLAETEVWFTKLWKEQVRRSSFLNGDLGMAEMGTMSLVPHKVIVVFGLDADSFPRQPVTDPDDLAGPEPTPESPRIADHQIFYDALTSAREKFIAVYAAFDPATAAPTPMPTPLIDLLALSDLCASGPGAEKELVHVHSPAQARSPARAAPAPGPPQAPLSAPAEVEIDDLCELYANPAAYWLRRNAGLPPSVLKETDPVDTAIPIALSALGKWQIVTRMTRLLLAQKTPEAIIAAELRRGELPPGQTGAGLAQECLAQAGTIVAQAKNILDKPLSWRSISLGDDHSPDLVGQIPVHGTIVLETLAGRVQPRQEIAAWIKVLSLRATYPDHAWKAVLVGSRGTVTLTAPEPGQARRHLSYLRRIHLKGLASPLPLPPAASGHLARFIARDLRPNTVEIERRLKDTWAREPSWPLIWPSHEQMTDERPEPDEVVSDDDSSSRFTTLTNGIYVPLMRAGGVS